MSIPSDMCTLVWPLVNRDLEKMGVKENAWLLGWNPRGLSVIVAWFLVDIPLQQAKDKLDSIKEKLVPINNLYKSLKLLGVVHCGATPTIDPNERQMRHTSDLWLSLTEGPLLDEIWCCKYRIQCCQLHIVRCDPFVRLSLKPDVFSATALYGSSHSVEQLLAGKMPICTDFVVSSLEGVLLPDVMLEESGPRKTVRFNAPSMEKGTALPSLSINPSASMYDNESGGDEVEGESLNKAVDFGSFFGAKDLEKFGSINGEPLKPLPPRLDFPTTIDTNSEISALLRECYAGKNVKRCIEGEEPHSLRWDNEETTPSVVTLSPFLLRIAEFALRVLLLLSRVTTLGSRFLYCAQTLDLKAREGISFLSLLTGRTTTCGLHPGLPHKVRHHTKKVCLYNYIVRVLVDAVLGFVISFFLIIIQTYLLELRLPRGMLYEIHVDYMEWFAGYPGGLKLNKDLSETFSLFARAVLHGWDALMLGYFGRPHTDEWGISFSSRTPNATPHHYVWLLPSMYLFAACSVLGASFVCAVLCDITNVVSFHLRFLCHVYTYVYRFALLLIGTLSRQFRGNKYNPLRNRVDGHEFQVDKMLMGSFLLTVVTFLFPTLGVFYAYFAFIRLSIFAVIQSILVVMYSILYLPFFPILYWILFRRRLVGAVQLSAPAVTMSRTIKLGSTGKETTSRTVEFSLQRVPLSLSVMLSDFVMVLRLSTSVSKILHILSGVLVGKVTLPADTIHTIVPHLVADPMDPPFVFSKKKPQ